MTVYLAWQEGFQIGIVLGIGLGALAMAFGFYAFTRAGRALEG